MVVLERYLALSAGLLFVLSTISISGLALNQTNQTQPTNAGTCPASIDISSPKSTYSPGDRFEFSVVIRDGTSNPIPNSNFTLSLNGSTQAITYANSTGWFYTSAAVTDGIAGTYVYTVQTSALGCTQKTDSLTINILGNNTSIYYSKSFVIDWAYCGADNKFHARVINTGTAAITKSDWIVAEASNSTSKIILVTSDVPVKGSADFTSPYQGMPSQAYTITIRINTTNQRIPVVCAGDWTNQTCTEGWKCTDTMNKAYQSSNCSWGISTSCPYGCSNGACAQSQTICTDSDGGIDYYTKGYVNASNGISIDTCYNGKVLFEYYCSNGQQAQNTYICPDGCNNGACIQPTNTSNTTGYCVTEGGAIPVIPNPPACCEGLTLIEPRERDVLGVSGICTVKCGNGVCDAATESARNCPRDCKDNAAQNSSCPRGCICEDLAVRCPSATQPVETNVSIAITGKISQIFIAKTIGEKIVITSNSIQAVTSENLTVQDSKLYVETSSGLRQIKFLPDDACARARKVTQVTGIELKEEAAKLLYIVEGTRNAHLFFVIPVVLDVETKVDAENGDVVNVNEPWWSFLAW